MVRIKYISQSPPQSGGYNVYLANEFKRVELAIDSVVQLLNALQAPIELGAADSGGIGYRVLRVPN